MGKIKRHRRRKGLKASNSLKKILAHPEFAVRVVEIVDAKQTERSAFLTQFRDSLSNLVSESYQSLQVEAPKTEIVHEEKQVL